MFLLSVTYPPWLVNKITLSSYENQKNYDLLAIDRTRLLGQITEMIERSQALAREMIEQTNRSKNFTSGIERIKNPTRAQKRQFLAEDFRLKQLEAGINEKQRLLNEAVAARNEATNGLDKKNVEIAYKARVIRWESRAAIVLSLIALFTAVGGALLTRKGFNLWSLRVQVYQDSILRKQAEAVEPNDSSKQS